ncbi:MAG: hypothetical protein WCF84_22050 [Anaerolineae bacterium]
MKKIHRMVLGLFVLAAFLMPLGISALAERSSAQTPIIKVADEPPPTPTLNLPYSQCHSSGC